MDVPTLVSQMNETLSTIHSTIASLNTTAHDARLDDLERQRDLAISSLNAAFAQETEALSRQRGAERDEIVERRRREDEERERRRREEDEELAEAQRKEDEERRGRLDGEAKGVEEETDEMMGSVEDEAQRMLEEGKEKLRALEEKRKVSSILVARLRLLQHDSFQRGILTGHTLHRSSTVSSTNSSRCLFRLRRRGGGAHALARTLRPSWPLKVSHKRLLWLLTSISVTSMSRLLRRTPADPTATCRGLGSSWPREVDHERV